MSTGFGPLAALAFSCFSPVAGGAGGPSSARIARRGRQIYMSNCGKPHKTLTFFTSETDNVFFAFAINKLQAL